MKQWQATADNRNRSVSYGLVETRVAGAFHQAGRLGPVCLTPGVVGGATRGPQRGVENRVVGIRGRLRRTRFARSEYVRSVSYRNVSNAGTGVRRWGSGHTQPVTVFGKPTKFSPIVIRAACCRGRGGMAAALGLGRGDGAARGLPDADRERGRRSAMGGAEHLHRGHRAGRRAKSDGLDVVMGGAYGPRSAARVFPYRVPAAHPEVVRGFHR